MKDAMGNDAPALNIEQIARACGVPHVHIIRFGEGIQQQVEIFQQVLQVRELALIIVQTQPVSQKYQKA